MDKIHIDAGDTEHEQGNTFTMVVNIDCAYPPLPVTWCIIANAGGTINKICDDQSGFADYFDGDLDIHQNFLSCKDVYNTDIVKSLESIFTAKLAKKRDTKVSFEVTVNNITLTIESNGIQVVGDLCAGRNMISF